ncbi:MAG: EpsD family peptidyl-prolyl cis-trans isomerase [Rhizobacter sp.]
MTSAACSLPLSADPVDRASVHRFVVLALALSIGLVVAGCDKKPGNKVTTQAAARVNGSEITVHQINHVLERQPALPPAQAASASRQVLTRLVDQELVIQEAQNQKVDRDPAVVRQLEASRRDVIARAYAERIGANVTRPTADEIKKYYEDNPALFAERRVYNLEEMSIEASAEQAEELRTAVQGAKDASALLAFVKAKGLRHTQRQASVPAERLPLDKVAAFSRMKDGQTTVVAMAGGLQALTLIDSRPQPVSEEQARPMIEQFLLNERRQKAIEHDLAALRAAAKIEYVGDFRDTPPQPSSVSASGPSANPASGAGLEKALKGMK